MATKLHALTLTGGEYQTHDYYMNIGPLFSDPLARQLYAEIASVESQHITHYGSMLNPNESILEKLLICEANEVWNYAACVEQETNPRVKALWARFLDYELGHFQMAAKLFKEVERRDPAEIVGDGTLPPFIQFKSQRAFIRKVSEQEIPMRKDGTSFVDTSEEGASSLIYRDQLNANGSPAMVVSATYSWAPGTELIREPELVTL